MATSSDQGSSTDAPTGSRTKGIAIFVLVVVALGIAAWVFLKPQWRTYAHGADKKEYYEKLVAEQDPAVLDVILDSMRDADQSDGVRLRLGEILIRKNRLNMVEQALKDPRLDVRVIALRTLSGQGFFQKQYVQDDSWGVKKTLVEWLADKSSTSRASAFSLVLSIYPDRASAPPEVVALVRGVLDPAAGASGTVKAAAAQVLRPWGDCQSAAAVLAAAKTETEGYARMRLLQEVERFYGLTDEVCKGALPETEVRALVDSTLLAFRADDSLPRGVRMAAYQILERHPDWAAPHVDEMRAQLESSATHEVEKATIFETLLGVKDPKTVASLPRHFFDPIEGMRSRATLAVSNGKGGIDKKEYESCLIGILRDEPKGGSMAAFRYAAGALRQAAGSWVGLPQEWSKKSGSLGEVTGPLSDLFQKGEFQGVTRAQFAEAWLRWLAERNGLKGAEVDAAVKANADFWVKAKAGDVDGAKAIYDANAPAHPKLWTYERGWLLTKGK